MDTLLHRINIIFIIILTLLPQSTLAQDKQKPTSKPSVSEVQDAVDAVIATLSTQLPDYGISSVMSSVPATTKAIFTLHPNTVMQTLTIAAMDNPDKQIELSTLRNRYQAISTAINTGDSSRWEEVVREEKEKQKKRITDKIKAESKMKKEQEDEERDSLNTQLSMLSSKIHELNSKVNTLIHDEKNKSSKFSSQLDNSKNNILKLIAPSKFSINYNDQVKSLCKENANYQKIISLLLDAIKDGGTLLNSKINQARERATSCKTDADSAYIKRKYQAAKDALAIMNQALAGAKQNLSNIEKNKNQISELYKHTEEEYDQATTTWNNEMSNTSKILKIIANELKTKTQEIHSNKLKLQGILSKLQSDLSAAKQYYAKLFPESATSFDQLSGKIKDAKSKLETIGERINKQILINQTLITTLSNLKPPTLPITPAPPECGSVNKSLEQVEEIESIIKNSTQLINANSDLAAGCTKKSDKKEDIENNKEDTPPPENTNPNTSDTTTKTPPQIETYGGLTIAGPSTVIVGSGLSFTACDGAGNPYKSGAFTWMQTRDDLMSLGRSGTTVSGVGFKEGSTTIILKYDGMTAYLDVKIKKKTSLFGSSGGTEKSNKPPLFSSSGGSENIDKDKINDNTDCNTCDFDKTAEGQRDDDGCAEIKTMLVNAINSGDVPRSELLRNAAVAMGCDIDVGVVNNYINTIKQDQIKKQNELADRQHQQKIRNIQNIQNLINSLNQLHNSKTNSHNTRPNNSQSHSHNNSNSSGNFQNLKNFGNASKKGSW